MRILFSLMLILLTLNSSGQSEPKILDGFHYETEILSTDEGSFNAWILNDEDAKGLFLEIKNLEKVEIDKSAKGLKFTTYTDGEYEYVVTKQKFFSRPKFFQITVYSI